MAEDSAALEVVPAAADQTPAPVARKDDGPFVGEGGTDLANRLSAQMSGAEFRRHLSPKEHRATLMAGPRAFRGIDPRDETEALLAAQMVALHENAMECLRRANLPEQPPQARHANLNLAVKLQRVFTLSLEALDRHRGKGHQKIEVSHVHVHSGGQAIVGNVNKSGEDTRK